MRACLAMALTAVTACALPCSRETSLVGLDGGPVVCTVANDCPRSERLVCSSNEDELLGCVDCVDKRCVQHARVACP